LLEDYVHIMFLKVCNRNHDMNKKKIKKLSNI